MSDGFIMAECTISAENISFPCCLQTPCSKVVDDLQQLSFELGWGKTVRRAKDTWGELAHRLHHKL